MYFLYKIHKNYFITLICSQRTDDFFYPTLSINEAEIYGRFSCYKAYVVVVIVVVVAAAAAAAVVVVVVVVTGEFSFYTTDIYPSRSVNPQKYAHGFCALLSLLLLLMLLLLWLL